MQLGVSTIQVATLLICLHMRDFDFCSTLFVIAHLAVSDEKESTLWTSITITNHQVLRKWYNLPVARQTLFSKSYATVVQRVIAILDIASNPHSCHSSRRRGYYQQGKKHQGRETFVKSVENQASPLLICGSSDYNLLILHKVKRKEQRTLITIWVLAILLNISGSGFSTWMDTNWCSQYRLAAKMKVKHNWAPFIVEKIS